MNLPASLTAMLNMFDYKQMGLLFVSTTALAPSSFTGYDASTFNIVLIPSSSTVYNSLKTAGFLDRNILWQQTT
jgi:hypothetical protein